MEMDPQNLGGGKSADDEVELRTRRLEAQLATVTARVFQLEREVAALRGAPAAVEAGTLESRNQEIDERASHDRAAGSGPAPGVQSAATYPAVPPPRALVMPAGSRVKRDERSLEARVGSQWFNRVGIVAVLIGMALFLKLAFDNHWIGATGRVLIGLVSGAVLIAWSERFRVKGFSGFSYSLKAVGSGVLYLSLWAAFAMFHLIAPGVAFAGMVLVTAFNAVVAWRQSAELLAVYAIVGAFSTPLLLSTGRNEEAFLFSYLLMMNAATMALLLLKGWNRLLLLSFLGTVGFFFGWYWEYYATALFTETAMFLSLFFLLFVAATVLAQRKGANAQQGQQVRLGVSVANAAFGFLGFYAMLSQIDGARSMATAWCSIAFGVLYLGLWRVMQRVSDRPPGSLSDLQLAIAVVFFTLAVPLGVHGNWVTMGWMAQGVVLIWLAQRLHAPVVQVLALGAFGLGLISLAMDAMESQTQVVWNTRFLSFAVAIAAMAVASILARRADPANGVSGIISWSRMGAVGDVITHVLVLIAVLLEISTYWTTRPLMAQRGTPMYASLLADRHMAQGFSYSAWFLLAGAAVLVLGFRRSSAALRWEGIVLLAATTFKVFLLDTSMLSSGYRSVSFLVLGALLLGVSFAYQRDWLHLRASARSLRGAREEGQS